MSEVITKRYLYVSKCEFDVVYYDIGTLEFAALDEPMPELPQIRGGCIVVVKGHAPIWRYGCALCMLHDVKHCSTVAFYEPGIGAVVVLSHFSIFRQGDILVISNDT
jgi:CRISPR-associated Csx3 family protein